MSTAFGYCTNIHPGTRLSEIYANLERWSLPVCDRVAAESNSSIRPGVGLWLSQSVVQQLADPKERLRFAGWLRSHDLCPFTINGFPFGDFHQPVVKHEVYRPDWTEADRFEYTMALAEIHHELLPEGSVSTISTLPCGWPSSPDEDRRRLEQCGQNLVRLAMKLAEFEDSTGREVIICLEPEPGCLIDTANDLVAFFGRMVALADQHEGGVAAVRRHLGVCHDICHSAVMFEPQEFAIQTYLKAGIRIGKVQVSSAVEVPFGRMSPNLRAAALLQLGEFAEPKFLHQTTIQESESVHQSETVHQSESVRLFEDLLPAIQASSEEGAHLLNAYWRVHFHVPIFLSSLKSLSTTQHEILSCLNALGKFNVNVPHFEVETYAWNEIPDELKVPDLVEGISRELCWWQDALQSRENDSDSTGVE